MAKAHYAEKDFVIQKRSDLGRYGYCRKCKGDMQAFKSDGYKLLHYNSHKNYRRV